MNLLNFSLYKLNKDFFIALFVLLIPFAFYVYNIAPQTKIWKTSLFEIDSGKFNDVNYYLWCLSIKFLTLFILTIWFLTNNIRWRNVLLISISSEIFKIFSMIQATETSIMYEGEPSYESFCFSIVYLIALFWISRKLNYYKPKNNDLTSFNNEIISQLIKLSSFDKKHYKLVEKELNILQNKKEGMNKKEYLTKLITLRDQLTYDD